MTGQTHIPGAHPTWCAPGDACEVATGGPHATRRRIIDSPTAELVITARMWAPDDRDEAGQWPTFADLRFSDRAGRVVLQVDVPAEQARALRRWLGFFTSEVRWSEQVERDAGGEA